MVAANQVAVVGGLAADGRLPDDRRIDQGRREPGRGRGREARGGSQDAGRPGGHDRAPAGRASTADPRQHPPLPPGRRDPLTDRHLPSLPAAFETGHHSGAHGSIVTGTLRLAVAVAAPGRHGLSLDVEADGRSATVRDPGPAIAITPIGTGTARIALNLTPLTTWRGRGPDQRTDSQMTESPTTSCGLSVRADGGSLRNRPSKSTTIPTSRQPDVVTPWLACIRATRAPNTRLRGGHIGSASAAGRDVLEVGPELCITPSRGCVNRLTPRTPAGVGSGGRTARRQGAAMANSQEPAGDGNSTEKAKLAWVNNAIVAGVVSAVIAGAISLTAVSSKITTTPYKRKPPRRYKPPGSWKQQRRPCSRPRTASMTTQTKCPEGVAWLQCSEHAAGYPTYVVDAANLQAVATVVADGTAGNPFHAACIRRSGHNPLIDGHRRV